ncbi:hypothetical protein ACN38_g5634, partial [Penicillium nordicum]
VCHPTHNSLIGLYCLAVI